MVGFDEFKSYEKFQSLTYDELKLAVNYICSNLSCPSYNYKYGTICTVIPQSLLLLCNGEKKEVLKNMQN